MGTESPKQPQDLDPKTKLRIAIIRSNYKTQLVRETMAALRAVVMLILEDEEVPEEVKEAVRERYEAYGDRRNRLIEKQVVECGRLIGGDSKG